MSAAEVEQPNTVEPMDAQDCSDAQENNEETEITKQNGVSTEEGN